MTLATLAMYRWESRASGMRTPFGFGGFRGGSEETAFWTVDFRPKHPSARGSSSMRERDVRRATWFRKTRCWKDRKCWVLRCTRLPRRQHGSPRYIVFFDPVERPRVWKYACDNHSRGLRRAGKVYKAGLKRLAQQAQRTLALHGSDEQVDAYLAAENQRAHRENLSATERLLIEDAPANVALLRRMRGGLPV